VWPSASSGRVNGDVKQIFFLLLLFSIGYRIGPNSSTGCAAGDRGTLRHLAGMTMVALEARRHQLGD
jgi:hypothetical protein